MGIYQGPAVAISYGAETHLTVELISFTRGWSGRGTAIYAGRPTLHPDDRSKLRFPDGREAEASFRVLEDFRAQAMGLPSIDPYPTYEITGWGDPPFT